MLETTSGFVVKSFVCHSVLKAIWKLQKKLVWCYSHPLCLFVKISFGQNLFQGHLRSQSIPNNQLFGRLHLNLIFLKLIILFSRLKWQILDEMFSSFLLPFWELIIKTPHDSRLFWWYPDHRYRILGSDLRNLAKMK